MMSLLSAAGEKFDSVIIDSPPVMGLADAPLLSSFAAGTLLVMAAGDTRRGVVKSALKRLYFARARMVGAVMNKFDFRAPVTAMATAMATVMATARSSIMAMAKTSRLRWKNPSRTRS